MVYVFIYRKFQDIYRKFQNTKIRYSFKKKFLKKIILVNMIKPMAFSDFKPEFWISKVSYYDWNNSESNALEKKNSLAILRRQT